MNFQELKKKNEKSQNKDWEEAEAEAISNNSGIAELEELEQDILKKAEITALRKSLAISVENYNKLKVEQNQALSVVKSLVTDVSEKIMNMSESNTALEKVIKSAAGASHKAAVDAITDVKKAIKDDLTEVLSSAGKRNQEREKVQNYTLYISVFNSIITLVNILLLIRI